MTTSFLQDIENNVPSLLFPPSNMYHISRLLTSCTSRQDSSHVDLTPHDFRKTVLSGFTFLFLHADSPYIDIVPLAGGLIDRTSFQTLQATHPTSPSTSSIVVYRNLDSLSMASSTDSLTLAMTRNLPPTALAWVQQGYIPLEEQELMHALLIEGEFKTIIQMNTSRCAKEMKLFLQLREDPETQTSQTNQTESDATESESEEKDPAPVPAPILQPPLKIGAIKRPEADRGNTNDDLLVEDFFEQLEEAANQPTFSVQEELLSESQHSIPKRKDEVEVPLKRRKVEHQEEWMGETSVQEPPQETSFVNESVSGGKGKKFVKKQITRSTRVIPLHPYQGSFVC